MKSGSLTTILISLLVAGAAVYFGDAWLSQRLASQVPEELGLEPVVTAARDIATGHVIGAEDLKVIQIPPQSRPEGAFSDPTDLLGATAKQPVYQDEILLERRILNDLSGSLLAVMLEPGKRAITMRVDDVSGVSGFLLPGSWVDVISDSRGRVRTLLHRLKIIAVGQQLDSGGLNAVSTRAVTLEVTPRQAEILAEAGAVRLVLRNPDDRDVPEQVVAKPAPAKPPEPEPEAVVVQAPPRVRERISVEVIRRTSVLRQDFGEVQ